MYKQYITYDKNFNPLKVIERNNEIVSSIVMKYDVWNNLIYRKKNDTEEFWKYDTFGDTIMHKKKYKNKLCFIENFVLYPTIILPSGRKHTWVMIRDSSDMSHIYYNNFVNDTLIKFNRDTNTFSHGNDEFFLKNIVSKELRQYYYEHPELKEKEDKIKEYLTNLQKRTSINLDIKYV